MSKKKKQHAPDRRDEKRPICGAKNAELATSAELVDCRTCLTWPELVKAGKYQEASDA